MEHEAATRDRRIACGSTLRCFLSFFIFIFIFVLFPEVLIAVRAVGAGGDGCCGCCCSCCRLCLCCAAGRPCSQRRRLTVSFVLARCRCRLQPLHSPSRTHSQPCRRASTTTAPRAAAAAAAVWLHPAAVARSTGATEASPRQRSLFDHTTITAASQPSAAQWGEGQRWEWHVSAASGQTCQQCSWRGRGCG